MRTELGKIRSVRYGFGGYQDAQFGITFDIGGEGWGVGDFWGMWADKPSKHSQWTRKEQIESHGKTADRICALLVEAKKTDVAKLVGVPVQCFFENNTLKSWRVLKEVL